MVMVCSLMSGHEGAQHVLIVALEGGAIGTEEDIAIAEAHGLGTLIELHTVLGVLQGAVGVAPMEEHHGVDEEGEDEVEEYAAYHDEETLPSGLGAELPRLWGLLHLLHIEALVNHARELYIAAKGYPAHYVLCLATFGLEAQQGFTKEERESLNTHTKDACKDEVSHLVYHDKQRQ